MGEKAETPACGGGLQGAAREKEAGQVREEVPLPGRGYGKTKE